MCALFLSSYYQFILLLSSKYSVYVSTMSKFVFLLGLSGLPGHKGEPGRGLVGPKGKPGLRGLPGLNGASGLKGDAGKFKELLENGHM